MICLKRAIPALLLNTLLFFAPHLFAQSGADQAPECNPGRPTVSTPATLTPVGYLQFENGGLYAFGSGEFDTQSSTNQVTRLAVNSRLQLLALSEPFAESKYAGGDSSFNPGGVSVGMQGVLSPGQGKRPTVSASYIQLLYGGTAPDIDIGTANRSGVLLVSLDAGGFHFDINGLANEQKAGGVRRAQFGQTLSVSRTYGKWTYSGELWHFSQPLTHGNAAGSLWAASYEMRRNLVVDAGFNRGLTSTSTQWEGFAGFTYLLPHRLWRAR